MSSAQLSVNAHLFLSFCLETSAPFLFFSLKLAPEKNKDTRLLTAAMGSPHSERGCDRSISLSAKGAQREPQRPVPVPRGLLLEARVVVLDCGFLV